MFFLPVSSLQILLKWSVLKTLKTIVAGRWSPDIEDVQSRVVAVGSVKLYAFKSPLITKSFFFTGRSFHQNQPLDFRPFQSKKSYFVFKIGKIFSGSKILILSKLINVLSVSLIFQIVKSKSIKFGSHFVLAKSPYFKRETISTFVFIRVSIKIPRFVLRAE